jgi:hypothetical protein
MQKVLFITLQLNSKLSLIHTLATKIKPADPTTPSASLPPPLTPITNDFHFDPHPLTELLRTFIKVNHMRIIAKQRIITVQDLASFLLFSAKQAQKESASLAAPINLKNFTLTKAANI